MKAEAMAYRNEPSTNWGVTIALVLAIPAGLAWCGFVYIGNALVCSGADVTCSSPWFALLEGLAVIAVTATGLAVMLNRLLRLAGRSRRR